MEYIMSMAPNAVPVGLRDRNFAEGVDVALLVMLTRKQFFPSGPYLTPIVAGFAWYWYQKLSGQGYATSATSAGYA